MRSDRSLSALGGGNRGSSSCLGRACVCRQCHRPAGLDLVHVNLQAQHLLAGLQLAQLDIVLRKAQAGRGAELARAHGIKQAEAPR